MPRYRVSADVGGTFTDMVFYDEESEEMFFIKVPSVSQSPATAVMNGLAKSKIKLSDMVFFSHGTTVGTNALIQRKIAKTGLVTTKGFRDVLEIRRGTRDDLWDAYRDVPPSYVPRKDRLEVDERIDYVGKVVRKLNIEEAKKIAATFKKRRMEAIAVCFVNSYVNGEHEAKMKKILKEIYPDAYLCISYEIIPEMLEFERTSTTVINACLGPMISKYLGSLTEMMRSKGYKHDILITHSAGGVMTAEAASNFASRMANSGPAAGAVAAAYFAKLAGFENVIGLDMGGTSADVSLTYHSHTRITREWMVEYGYPIIFPCVDMVSIGAGGGSVAWIDPGGSLRNGPQSMGAEPGPACYMRGGTEPTNTDANLILERLNDKMFLGGEMKVSKEAAVKVVREKIANPLGYRLEEAADAILKVANANMMDAVRLISIRKGYDPREFVLVSFGGAGPLHCPYLARELRIPKVLVPPRPGLTSAMGCLLMDLRHDFSRTIVVSTKTVDTDKLEKEYEKLEKEAYARLKEEGAAKDKMKILRAMDMRYIGQWRSLTVSCPAPMNPKTLESTCEKFHAEHEREYAFSRREQEVEIHGLRVTAIGVTAKPKLPSVQTRGSISQAKKGTRKVYFSESGGFTETTIYDRQKLFAGAEIEGPSIVEQMDSTVIIPPKMNATADKLGNLLIDVR